MIIIIINIMLYFPRPDCKIIILQMAIHKSFVPDITAVLWNGRSACIVDKDAAYTKTEMNKQQKSKLYWITFTQICRGKTTYNTVEKYFTLLRIHPLQFPRGYCTLLSCNTYHSLRSFLLWKIIRYCIFVQ